MKTLYTNVHWTKRKSLHHVLNEHDEPEWSGAKVYNALEHMLENGDTTFRVQGEGTTRPLIVTVAYE